MFNLFPFSPRMMFSRVGIYELRDQSFITYPKSSEKPLFTPWYAHVRSFFGKFWKFKKQFLRKKLSEDTPDISNFEYSSLLGAILFAKYTHLE